jgi:endonuclease/exonuclease/phosphatase family metal-dependent hydrolase
MRTWITYLLLLIFWSAWPQDTARVMFYNLLEFPEAPPANRELILKDILSPIQPDIFMVAELQDDVGSNIILDESLNHSSNIYAAAPFVFNTSGNGGTINVMLYYNTNKFSLELTDNIQTSLRDINRYQLKAKTTLQQTNPIILECFVAHFKASQGSSNEQIRFNMAQDFTNYLNANLSPDANVILAGDFNFYSANESGFLQLFIGNTIIPMNDPVNQLGDWNSNSTYSAVHTQSTRTSSSAFNNFGAGGGLDDRFDIIFVSSNLLDPSNEVHYIANTYQTYGNNGNCYNDNISDTSCNGPYSQTTRNLLYNMSDHLPIVMDLQLSQDFLKTNSFAFQEVFSFPEGNIADFSLALRIDSILLDKIKSVEIYNALGQQIAFKNLTSEVTIIDVTSLSNGVYYLKPQFGKVQKFIVVR